jgi:hypothetical protein
MHKYVIAAVALAAVSVPLIAMSGADSGLKVGEFVTPFHPNHVTGPHKGTKTCPPCTYGNLPQVQVWVNGDDTANVAELVKLVDGSMAKNQSAKLKGFFIFLTDKSSAPAVAQKLEKLGETTHSDRVALAWLPKDDEAVGNYKVNVSPDVKNTVFVYRDRKVVAKFVNLKGDAKGLQALEAAIEKIVR